MADSYLIDGYNLIHALGMIQKHVGPGGLEASRRQLIDFLAAGFGNLSAHVTIVFDAKQAPRRAERSYIDRGLTIQFAPKDQTADDRIETLIRETPQPRMLVVVSNDMRLQAAAKRHGGQAWTHEMLLDFLEQRQADTAAMPDEKDAPTPEETAHWRREFEGLERDPELKKFFEQDRFE